MPLQIVLFGAALTKIGKAQRCNKTDMVSNVERGEKTPTPKISTFSKKTARFTKGQFRPC